MKIFITSLLACLLLASTAWADDICADRPSKSSEPCTVDAGHWQVESDIYNVTYQSQDGINTITTLATDPTIKYGLTKNSDIEFSLAPETIVTVRDGSKTNTFEGIGDLYARMKFEVVNDQKWQMALSPYVKVPTADHNIGNGVLEGGLSAPNQYIINTTWAVTFVPEVDIMKNNLNSGYHINTSEVLSLNANLPHKLNATFEVWNDMNFDPAVVKKQYSADLALAWTPKPDIEFDGGINFGLNKDTPRAQFYLGFAKHF